MAFKFKVNEDTFCCQFNKMQGNWQQTPNLWTAIGSWLRYWLASDQSCSALHAGSTALFFHSNQVHSTFWATKFLPQLTNTKPHPLKCSQFRGREPFAVLLHQIVVVAKYCLLPQTQQLQKWQRESKVGDSEI